MSELHVLGIGSPYGDDRLGWEVIKQLQQQDTLAPYIPQRLHLTCCDRPGMHLLELMRPASTVFLIDAVKTGATIGTLHRFSNEEIMDINLPLSTHGFGVAQALQLGKALQALPELVTLYGVEIDNPFMSFECSKPILKAIKALALLMEKDIQCVMSR